jgi:predicted enzyme related to lactoylglutathione lyase
LRPEGDLAENPPVTSKITVIAIDAVRPRDVAEFWCAVLDWRVVEEDETGISIAPNDGTWPTIDVLRVPEDKAVKNRIHLDLRADGSTATEEVERVLALGARRVDIGQEPGVSWTVLADPEGNEFCILSRTVRDVAAGGG